MFIPDAVRGSNLSVESAGSCCSFIYKAQQVKGQLNIIYLEVRLKVVYQLDGVWLEKQDIN